jgi:hypothetical protein
MSKKFCEGCLVAALVTIMTTGSATFAQAETSDAAHFGTLIAHEMFQAMNARALFAQNMPSVPNFGDEFGRPQWSIFMRDSLSEELDADMPKLEEALGRNFARDFTFEELQAATVFFDGPGGKAMLADISADANKQAPPTKTREAIAAINKFARLPLGKSFLEKLSHIDNLLGPVTQDFTALVIPGSFIRFGQKARDAETVRQAGH